MGVYGYFVIIGIAIIFFAVQSVMSKRAREEKMRLHLDEAFGNRPNREYKHDEYSRIRFYFDSKQGENSQNTIDDITWNDLSMDNIFMLLNNTNSSVGEEYLYNMIRTINFDQASLDEFDHLNEYFLNNPEVLKKIQYLYTEMGRTRSISFFDFIHRLGELKKKSNLVHYLSGAISLFTIGMFFVNSAVAVMVLLVAFSFNIYTYYKEKSQVGSYFVCCKYLVGLVENAKEIENQRIEKLNSYNKRIHNTVEKLSFLTKNMWVVSDGTMSDSLLGFIMEYVKMLFHVDLIKFNSIIKKTEENIESIDELFDILGRIEAATAVASFKKLLINEYGAYCKPNILRNTRDKKIGFKELYHPCKKNAVKNSMDMENAVLVTGSNASGKSTFLKTVAINGVLAQTIGTVCGDYFEITECLVYSSMALRDDLESDKSYYIVEIKSLKRILDMADNSGKTVMCFIDEVLKGTNTVERIAASSVILNELAMKNTIAFAATHDIELTKILETVYKNYHFEEDFAEDDILFNYKLKMGPATTRNAIKLLKVMGYDRNIIEGAKRRAEDFMLDGIWK